MKFRFLCARPFLPENLDGATLGGTEQAILHLAEALAAHGADVTISGAATRLGTRGGVRYSPELPAAPALGIAVNDARLLRGHAGPGAVWLHNEVSLWRETRRSRLPALLRHRPAAIFVGTTQAAAAGKLPVRARHILPHGLTPAYLRPEPAAAPPAPLALFTSQAYRGLAELCALWRHEIAPALPQARFEARIAEADLAAFRNPPTAGLAILPRLPNAAMPDRLRAARVLLAPGHVSETFCLAAAEAIALGAPVITRGWGALAERVADGQTGFVCRSWPEFAARTRQVLTDDALWRRLHAGCLAAPRLSWPEVARKWLAAFAP